MLEYTIPYDLSTVRRQLLREIAQRPPVPVPTIPEMREWGRQRRRTAAQRILRTIPHTTKIAEVAGVTTRTVRYWRAGTHTPTATHWQCLLALASLCFAAEVRGARRARAA